MNFLIVLVPVERPLRRAVDVEEKPAELVVGPPKKPSKRVEEPGVDMLPGMFVAVDKDKLANRGEPGW